MQKKLVETWTSEKRKSDLELEPEQPEPAFRSPADVNSDRSVPPGQNRTFGSCRTFPSYAGDP